MMLADRPGEVAVSWLGYRIETSVLVAGLALVVLVLALMVVFAFVRGILRSPEQVSLFFRHRRGDFFNLPGKFFPVKSAVPIKSVPI